MYQLSYLWHESLTENLKKKQVMPESGTACFSCFVVKSDRMTMVWEIIQNPWEQKDPAWERTRKEQRTDILKVLSD